jgi:hypothetical protein
VRQIARLAAVALLTFAFAAIAIPATPQAPRTTPRTPDPPLKIDIRAQPITGFDARDPSRRQFGELLFRGGLELTSSYKEFGGLSAIRVAADGARFVAVSDKGRWFRGRIVYRDGRPAGIADAETAPILGPDSRPITARGWYDAEAIADDGNTLYVGLERVHQILRFDYGKDGLLARGVPIAVPASFRRLPSNKGIECLVFVPKGLPGGGTLIAISERALDAAKNIRAILIGGSSPGEFSVARSDDFDVSDCAVTPRGELLLLERRFFWTSGIAMRMRRIALAGVKPGAVVDGPVVVEADMGYQIDNMEGLSVHRTPDNELVLTLISDDNFSILQRTILLQFTLMDARDPRAMLEKRVGSPAIR